MAPHGIPLHHHRVHGPFDVGDEPFRWHQARVHAQLDALGHALNLPAPQLALERLFAGALRGEARDNLTAVVIRQ